MITNFKVAAMLLLTMTCAAQSAPKAAGEKPKAAGNDWYSYGGDSGGTHYSTLKQITKSNVGQLKEAWRFVTPDAGSTEASPLNVNGTMYVLTPTPGGDRARCGKIRQNKKWAFDSGAGVGTLPPAGLRIGPMARKADYSARWPAISMPSMPQMERRSRISATMAVSIFARTWTTLPQTSPSASARRPSSTRIF